MDDTIAAFLEDNFNIRNIDDFEFHECFGFTFAFKREIICINDQLSSASITPVGIIYEENGEYYFAPLHENVEIDEIIKEYIKA